MPNTGATNQNIFSKSTGIENIEYLKDIGLWHEYKLYILMSKMIESIKLNKTVEYKKEP